MKKIIFLGFILFFALACKAQQPTAPSIVPVEKKVEYIDADIDIPDDTYLKDVNHLFDKYIGTWKGTYNNRNYTFLITKETDAYLNLLEDRLLMHYIITDASGIIIANSTTNSPDSDPSIFGRYFIKNAVNNYVLSYIGKNAKCGQIGVLQISTSKYIPVNPTQMKMSYYQDNVMINETDCPGFVVAEQIMPGKGGIILTKQ